MAEEIRNFFINSEIEAKKADDGITRKVLAHNKNLMVCELHFQKGAVGKLHEHFHEQCSYIISGKFEMEIGGKKVVLGPGDSTYKQPGIVHGGVCLEEGTLLDIFTPEREDFLG
ncbi:MAG: cupin domain-containing protein [Candidatus Ornithospirochaeta sp.]|nr:cupin domain-containing protein [Candidatus Ornithospirochaeta sp.]